LNPDFHAVLSEFSGERVEFLVVGAFALAAHGIPRATGDIDLWIRMEPDNARRVWRALARFGAPLVDVSEADFLTPDTVIQIGVPPSRIDVLTSIDGVEFTSAWERRVTVDVGGLVVPVIGREDLMHNKSAAGRPQDVADVARLRATGPVRKSDDRHGG